MHALQAHYMLPVQGVQHTSHNHSQADKEDREGGQGWDQALTDFKAMLAEMSHSIHAQGEPMSMPGGVPTTS